MHITTMIFRKRARNKNMMQKRKVEIYEKRSSIKLSEIKGKYSLVVTVEKGTRGEQVRW